MKGIWMNLQMKIAKKGCIRCSFEAHERKEVVKAMIEPKFDRQGMDS